MNTFLIWLLIACTCWFWKDEIWYAFIYCKRELKDFVNYLRFKIKTWKNHE